MRSAAPWDLLRAGTLVLLGALLALGVPETDRVPEGELDLAGPLRVAGADLISGAGTDAFATLLSEEEERARWERMLRHAAEAALLADVSGSPPPFSMEPPDRLRAGRPTALQVVAHRAADLRLVTSAGVESALELEAGERSAFVLRPRAGGWTTWTVEWASPPGDAPDGGQRPGARRGASGGTGGALEWTGWAEPARPLRILAMSGPPGSESRLAMRALEEAGEEVDAWIHLGRDLWVGRSPGPLPDAAEAFEAYDAVILFPGIDLPTGTAEALERAVREGGLGLLLAAAEGGSGRLLETALREVGAQGWGGATQGQGDELAWRLPAEIEPLPASEIAVALRDLLPTADASEPRDAGEHVPLVVGTLGRGRTGALALVDTWRWRMEAGAEAEHRAFWRSLAEWLAGGLGADPAIEVLGAPRSGEAVAVRWVGRRDDEALAGGMSDAPGRTAEGGPLVRVEAPDGRVSTLGLTALRESAAGRIGVGAFVPFAAGGYRLVPVDGDEEPLTMGIGMFASDLDPGRLDPEGALARLALSSPGGGVGVAGRDDPASAGGVERRGESGVWRVLLFVLLAGLLGGEWGLRRARGTP